MVSLWSKIRKILPSCTIHNERYNRSSLGRCSGNEPNSYFRERWSKATVSYNSCKKYSSEEIKSIYRRYGHNHWLHMDWAWIPFYQCDADFDQCYSDKLTLYIYILLKIGWPLFNFQGETVTYLWFPCYCDV